MKFLLSKLGLDDIPYLLDVIDAGWRITLVLILAWVALVVASRLIQLLRRRLTSQIDNMAHVKRIETMTHVFQYVVRVVVILVAGMLVLGELGISIAPLLATAGVAGVAIGFGVQSLVKDYFTGVVLLFENQIRNGDVIEAGGKTGVVEEVTLRYVRLRDDAGVVHFVPNGLITTVGNHSMDYAYAVIDAGIAYGSDIDEALATMREQAAGMRAEPDWSAKIVEDLEVAGVNRWDDSSVMLRARLKTLPLEQWSVKREFLRRLKYAFDANGIEIPYPQLTIHAASARNSTPFPVRIETAAGDSNAGDSNSSGSNVGESK